MVQHDIGWAVDNMWRGNSVRRSGWNGKKQYVRLQVPDSGSANTLPYVYIITESGERVPWLCSQSDLLATDWELAS